jgi:catechol 2,3-dioxygenase-like lactoylglutathione lyase family enzyme
MRHASARPWWRFVHIWKKEAPTVGKVTLEFWHHHAGVSVPDLEAAIAWYREVLGFELARRFPIESIPADVAVLRNGPLHIELFQVPGAQPGSPERRIPDRDLYTHGTKHVSFAVENVALLAQELRRRGADIVWVKEMKHGSNAFIRDNSGNLIEFVQSAKPQDRFATLSMD